MTDTDYLVQTLALPCECGTLPGHVALPKNHGGCRGGPRWWLTCQDRANCRAHVMGEPNETLVRVIERWNLGRAATALAK